MKFSRDQDNAPKAEDEGDLGVLAEFLSSDIQGDKQAAIDLLQFLEKKSGERVGNAFSLEFSDTSVLISPLHTDDVPVAISRVIFFQAVEAWIVFISE